MKAALHITLKDAVFRHVTLLTLLVGALAPHYAHSTCSTRRFLVNEGYALVGQVIATHHVLISAECMDLCTSQPKCVSYNYQYTGPAPHRCELNDATANMCPGSLQPRTGFKYCEDKDAKAEVLRPPNGSFRAFQDVRTSGGWDAEWFEISNRLFLAFANYRDDFDYDIKSFVYELQNNTFVLNQAIDTVGAESVEYFSIDESHYLAFGHKRLSRNYNQMSKIYVWSGSEFTYFQQIPTSGASDVCFLDDGSLNKFLFVANYFNNASFSINSTVYRWVGGQFVYHQGLPTDGARGCKAFFLNGDAYVAFANRQSASNGYNTFSFLYKLSGHRFALFQTFSTSGAGAVEAFSVGKEDFLAFNNLKNETTYELTCDIYKWSGSRYKHFQSVPTVSPMRLKSFRIEGHTLLAVTSFTQNLPNSAIYVYTGKEFRKFQDIPVPYVTAITAFQRGDDYYLAASKYKDSSFIANSTIFKWQP